MSEEKKSRVSDPFGPGKRKTFHINRTDLLKEILTANGNWSEAASSDTVADFAMWDTWERSPRRARIQTFPRSMTDVMDHKGEFYAFLRRAGETRRVPKTFLTWREVEEARAEEEEGGEVWFLKAPQGTLGKQVFAYTEFEDLRQFATQDFVMDHWVVQRGVPRPFTVGGLKCNLRVMVLVALWRDEPATPRFFVHGRCFGWTQPEKVLDADRNTANRAHVKIGAEFDPETFWPGWATRGFKAAAHRAAAEVLHVFRKPCFAWPGEMPSAAPDTDTLGDDTTEAYYVLAGVDVLFDEAGFPWIIEINTFPSLWEPRGVPDRSIRYSVKRQVLEDTASLLQSKGSRVGGFQEQGFVHSS